MNRKKILIPFFFILLKASSTNAIELEWYDYAQTAVSGTGLGYSLLFIDSPPQPKWKGGIAWDDELRDALKYETKENREIANSFSDYFMGTSLAAPTILALFTEDRWERGLVVANAILTQAFLNNVMKKGIARERPFVRGCKKDKIYGDCRSATQNESFYSGHSALSSTGAGILCAQEFDGWCLIGATVSLTTGYLRIAADKHYFSDVLTGFAMGALVGYILPKIEHNDLDEREFEVSVSLSF
jgi:membrane-associated phospholipid phosphatase